MADRTLTSGQIAQELGVSAASVQRYARGGKIPHDTTLGGHYRFDLEEVKAAVASELPIEQLRVPDDEVLGILRAVLAGEPVESEQVLAAIRSQENLRESCQFILGEADRFRSEGNAGITMLEQELDELVRGLRALYLDAEDPGIHPRYGMKHLIEGMRLILREEGALDHEHCPTCRCWERYRGEV